MTKIVDIGSVVGPVPKVKEKLNLVPGDLVMLKSGGYAMTVGRIVSPEAGYETGKEIGVHCHWHNECGSAETDVYMEEQLKRVT